MHPRLLRMTKPHLKPPLAGVVFDMDGTLTVPNLDFALMYKRCGVSRSDDLLSAVEAMAPDEAARARDVIDEMEAEGRRTLRLEPGAVELCRWLRAHHLPVALVTRNSALSVDHLHQALCEPAGMPRFEPAISRDDASIPPKPSPTALRAIATHWGLTATSLLMVGDSPSNDIAFGKAAGTHTALVSASGRHVVEDGASSGGADLVVTSLADLPRALWEHFSIDGSPMAGDSLPKVAAPTPLSAASLAAAQGDVDTLAAMDVTMLAQADLPQLDQTCLDSTPSPPRPPQRPHQAMHQADAAAPSARPPPNRALSNTPLIWAADGGHVAAVRLILERLEQLAAAESGGGAPSPVVHAAVNARGFLGATAVSRAARGGHLAALGALCAVRGIDLDVANEKMQTPLHFAAFKRHDEAVRLLLDAGASTRSLDRKGRTPAEDTDVEEIRELILSVQARAGC